MSCFYCMCMYGLSGYVCACLSLNMTGKCKHLGACSRKECILTIVKAFGIVVMYSLQHSGALGWFQVRYSNVFSREASVKSFISHCDCGPLSNISAPQFDPWSFLPLLFPVHCPLPPFSTPALPIMDDPG